MMGFSDDQRFEQVARRLDPHGTLLRVWPLTGGVSAQMTGLEIRQANGQTQKLVVRQHGPVDRQHNPHIAADEFRLLRLLQSLGIPVPAPYDLDDSGEIFTLPYLVTEYVEGQSDFAPSDVAEVMPQIALHLSRIHAINASSLDLSFLPRYATRVAARLALRPAQVNDELDEGRIRDTLVSVWPLAPRNRPVLLHGDFWPGNILWRDGRLVAVVDWEDAAVGDPLVDIANSRLEFLWAYGVEAMQILTEHYQALTTLDWTDLPYWDLWAALRPVATIATWGLDQTTEQRMREEHHWFVTDALRRLAVATTDPRFRL